MADRQEHSRGFPPDHEADDREEQPSEEAKRTKDPLHGWNFWDQSQGPNQPLDESGRKKTGG